MVLAEGRLTPERLVELGREFLVLHQLQKRLEARYPNEVLQALRLYRPLEGSGLVTREHLDDWRVGLRATVSDFVGADRLLGVDAQYVDADRWNVEIRYTSRGSLVTANLDRDFLTSSEYRHLNRLGRLFDDPLAAGAVLRRGDEETPIHRLAQAFELLLEAARRGAYVQRYKGLGEMNPEQLWETTMNAETRNLVQVCIEDAVAADEIFSILMGDQVEPRREFIERYARTVTNLDT